jgi:hypothetical protein
MASPKTPTPAAQSPQVLTKAAAKSATAKPVPGAPKAKRSVANQGAATKSTTRPVAKAPASNIKAKVTLAVKPAAKTKAPSKTETKAETKTERAKKPKLVRDSFTIPKTEYLVIDALKERAGKLSRAAKKSELLRAGIKALAAMSDDAFLAALSAVPTIKTGRPTLA